MPRAPSKDAASPCLGWAPMMREMAIYLFYIIFLSSTLLCIEVPQFCIEDDDDLSHEGSDGDDALLSVSDKALIGIM